MKLKRLYGLVVMLIGASLAYGQDVGIRLDNSGNVTGIVAYGDSQKQASQPVAGDDEAVEVVSTEQASGADSTVTDSEDGERRVSQRGLTDEEVSRFANRLPVATAANCGDVASQIQMPDSVRASAAILGQKPSQAPSSVDGVPVVEVPDVAVDVDVWGKAKEEELNRLKEIPAAQMTFEGAPLRSVLIALAMRCEMQIMAPREGDFDETVSLSVSTNPWRLLDVLCQRYGVGLRYEQGIWQFYKPNVHELVWRSYLIRYDDLLQVEIDGPDFNQDLNSTSGSSSSDSSYGSNSGSGTDSKKAFTMPEKSVLEERVRAALRLPTTALRARAARLSWSGSYGPFGEPGIESDIYRADEGQGAVPAGDVKDRVMYLPETSTLMVLGTRQQHEYIESLITAMDRPKQQIQYSAKLFETSSGGTKSLGIDWTGVTSPTATLSEYAGPTAKDGFAISSAILSASDLSMTLKLIASNNNGELLSEPQVVGASYAPVSISSVEQRPVKALVVQSADASSDTVQSSIRYIQVGTIFNVFGRVLDSEMNGRRAIQMWVSVTDSQMVGEIDIDGDAVPVVASQEVCFPVTVPDGFTLAVGGVTKEAITEVITKVPLLGDIPLLGRAFRETEKEKSHSRLVVFITPKLLTDVDGNLVVSIE